jgi:hypothetical protein
MDRLKQHNLTDYILTRVQGLRHIVKGQSLRHIGSSLIPLRTSDVSRKYPTSSFNEFYNDVIKK